MTADLDPVEIRVLGCLVEKQRTTPDAYPLTLNALRLACNQSTNRDPVVEYDEATVRDAAQRLGRRRLARLASGHTTRATKYRHLLDEALGLSDAELALLCVLMLRGPQTPGELKGRGERLHHFPDLASVEDTLAGLIERGHAQRLERRPGQKEVRYRHLLDADAGVDADADAGPDADGSAPESPPPDRGRSSGGRSSGGRSSGGQPSRDELEPRVAALEREVGELRAQLDALRRDLGVD